METSLVSLEQIFLTKNRGKILPSRASAECNDRESIFGKILDIYFPCLQMKGKRYTYRISIIEWKPLQPVFFKEKKRICIYPVAYYNIHQFHSLKLNLHYYKFRHMSNSGLGKGFKGVSSFCNSFSRSFLSPRIYLGKENIVRVMESVLIQFN